MEQSGRFFGARRPPQDSSPSGGAAPTPEGGAASTPYDPILEPPPGYSGTLYVWRCYSDCEICSTNKLDGPVEQGHVFPSGHTEPPAHNHCNCDLEVYIPGVSRPVWRYWPYNTLAPLDQPRRHPTTSDEGLPHATP